MTPGAGEPVVRAFRSGDLAAVERITAAAYGRPTSPSMRERAAIGGAMLLVADCGGEVAGVVGASAYGAAAYVASMAVDPALRRRGIARALMAEIVASLEARGTRAIVLDATDAGAPLYAAFGFVDVDRTSIFEREGAPPRAAPAITGTASAAAVDAAAFERVLRLDRDVAGCDRSAMLRDFAALPDAYLAADTGGFVMVRGDVLGPWLADNDGTAAELLERAARARPHVRRAFVPGANPAAAALLAGHGFTAGRTLRHMTRGPSPFRRSAIYGQASLGHG